MWACGRVGRGAWGCGGEGRGSAPPPLFFFGGTGGSRARVRALERCPFPRLHGTRDSRKTAIFLRYFQVLSARVRALRLVVGHSWSVEPVERARARLSVVYLARDGLLPSLHALPFWYRHHLCTLPSVPTLSLSHRYTDIHVHIHSLTHSVSLSLPASPSLSLSLSLLARSLHPPLFPLSRASVASPLARSLARSLALSLNLSRQALCTDELAHAATTPLFPPAGAPSRCTDPRVGREGPVTECQATGVRLPLFPQPFPTPSPPLRPMARPGARNTCPVITCVSHSPRASLLRSTKSRAQASSSVAAE